MNFIFYFPIITCTESTKYDSSSIYSAYEVGRVIYTTYET